MEAQHSNLSPATNEIVDEINGLQDEIFDREDEIEELVKAADGSEELATLVREGADRRQERHLERLLTDWDAMVTRSREKSENDFELLSVLVRFVGDLLVVQEDGIDRFWIEKLGKHLERKRGSTA